MSSVLRPRGPQSASVYWRRRAVVIAVAVVVVVIMSMLFFGGGDSKSEAAPAASPTASPTPTPTPSPSASASGSPSASPSQSASASPSSSPTATAATCSDGDIEVVVTTDKQTYAAGENPVITMTIANTSNGDCMRDIGSGANTFKVSSGGFHAWSSDDCDPSQASNVQLLPAGAKAEAKVTWERKLSSPGCAGQAPAAQTGVYQVEASNGKVSSEQVRITLQ